MLNGDQKNEETIFLLTKVSIYPTSDLNSYLGRPRENFSFLVLTFFGHPVLGFTA
jgi:nitrate reductase NapE component